MKMTAAEQYENAGGTDQSAAAPAHGGFVPVLVGGRDVDWAAPDAGLPTDVLGARICAMATRMAQATFHWLQMIAEFDRREGWAGVGIRSCAHWLAWTCSMGVRTAREHVRVARALEGLPVVSAEMAAGRLSYAKVREITRVSDRVEEATLVELARTATASQLARTVRGFRAADGSRGGQEQGSYFRWTVGDDGCLSFSGRLPSEEGAVVVAAWQAARDDVIRLSGRDPDTLPGCPDGDRPEVVSRDDDSGDNSSGETTGEGRDGSGDGVSVDGGDRPGVDSGNAAENASAGNRPPVPVDPVEVMLQWARGYLSAAPQDRSGEDRTMVVVHVNAEHLLADQPTDATTDIDGGAATTDTGAYDASACATATTDGADTKLDENDPTDSYPDDSGPDDSGPDGGDQVDRSAIPVDCCTVAGVGGITPETAARLACDATVVGMIRGAGGVVLAHGRKRRTVSAAQRRVLGVRDGGCQFPSCARTSHLEAHHVRHWAHGGRTDLDNLILLCRFHHMACHEGGVMISYGLGSVPGAPEWHFTTRDGDALLGDRLPSGAPGWKHDEWILWHELDGSAGWRDPEAERIRPLWAGERFSLADAVGVLFQAPVQGLEDGPDTACTDADVA
jgi:hypothetical protein